MEEYLFKPHKSINEDILNGREGVSKKLDKKRKIKAPEIQIKEFFSDDDNDENEEIFKGKRKKIVIFSKHTNKRKVDLKLKFNYSNNSILIYKEQLHKKSTIEQSPNKRRERQNILIEDITDKDTIKDKSTKKVTFSKNNFIQYINIESYKKYNNFFYTNEVPYSDDKIKCEDTKCCLIY